MPRSSPRAAASRSGRVRLGTAPSAPRDATALGAGLERRARGGRDAEHAHRLEPEAQLLAPVARADVVAGELAYPLQAVVDRVAVREQPLRGTGDIAVGLQKGLERAHQIGLILLVVGDEGLDRLVVEALKLLRVLTHRGEQQPVGAG